MGTARLPSAHATLYFKSIGCMIGINALGTKTDFHLVDGRLKTSCGQEIEWPTEEAGRRVLEMHRRAPECVFVVEFGPFGPIAEHPVH